MVLHPNRISPVDITEHILQLIFMYQRYWRFMDNHKEIVHYFCHLKNINVSKSCSDAFDRKKHKNYICGWGSLGEEITIYRDNKYSIFQQER